MTDNTLPKMLSDHFSLAEFIRSWTATRLGIINKPDAKQLECMKQLCRHIMEPVRQWFGVTNVSSGLRVKLLNKKIGGSSTSQHVVGEADDFTCAHATPYEICEWIIASNLPFWQLIYEGDWVHVSYKHGQVPKREVKTAIFEEGKKTRYVAGLVKQEN